MKFKHLIFFLFILSLTATTTALQNEREHMIEIEIESQASQSYENYPVKVEIPGDELSNQLTSYNLDKNCDIYGSNLGFINPMEDREYDFWIQEGNCDEEFTAWVNIPYIQSQSNQNQPLKIRLYSGQDFENTNIRRSVFDFFEDFQSYTPGQPVERYRNWNIKTLSGEQEQVGRADITATNKTNLISENGRTTITHPLDVEKEEDLRLEIMSQLNGTGGSTIGYTDGRTFDNGSIINGYYHTLNDSSSSIIANNETSNSKNNPYLGSQDNSINLNTDEKYIQSLKWSENNIKASKNTSEHSASLNTYNKTLFATLSANQNTELDIDWVRARKEAENKPIINNGNPITSSDIEQVQTDTPTIDSARPNGQLIHNFSIAKLDIQQVDYNHIGNSNLSVHFKSPKYGTLGYDKITTQDLNNHNNDDKPLASTTWPDLNHSVTYEWQAIICDKHLNCNENNPQTFSFTINDSAASDDINSSAYRQDLYQGLRDDDFAPQGFYEEEAENPGTAKPAKITYEYLNSMQDRENWVVMTRELTSQLEPGMETNSYSMKSEKANPSSMHRYFNFIERPDRVNDSEGSTPMWFDSITSTDRAKQYALAPTRDWAVDTTGRPYPTVQSSTSNTGVYVRYELFNDINPTDSNTDYIRQNREDGNVPKASRAMANSLALTASDLVMDQSGADYLTEDGIIGDSGQTIKGPLRAIPGSENTVKYGEGMGFWIDPDDLRIYHPVNDSYSYSDPVYEENLNVILENSPKLDITGPDSGVGYYYPEATSGDGATDVRTFNDRVPVVFGDIYWEDQHLTDEEDPNKNEAVSDNLNPFMCGDDKDEYLLEEVGHTENSATNSGKYACISHNEACVSWSADTEKKYFSTGEYQKIDSASDGVGRTKNSEKACFKYGFSHKRFSGTNIEDDKVPAWYSQDLSPELCRENTLFAETDAVRWIEKSEIEENPYAYQGGINDDLNTYLHEDKDLNNKLTYYKYNDTLTQDNNLNLDLDPGDQTPIPTGKPEGSMSKPYQENASITAGFCGGDDSSEYFKYQDCQTDFCQTNTSIKGISSSPNQCILETNSTLFSSVPGFDSSKGQNGFEDYKGQQGQRRIYNQQESVTIKTVSGDEPISCYGGRWYESDSWPLVHDIENKYEIALGENLGVQFQVLNPTNTERTFNVSYDAQNDIKPFTEFLTEDNKSYQLNVDSNSLKTETIAIEGGKVISNSDDNLINLTVQASNVDKSGSKEFKVVVNNQDQEVVGSQSSSSTELPGPSTPFVILALVLTTILSVIKKE